MVKQTTTQRGYGAAHRRQRQQWAVIVAAGKALCARCGQTIRPGAPWDLGHTDNRDTWTGPEHTRCNRRAGALTAAQLAAGKREAWDW